MSVSVGSFLWPMAHVTSPTATATTDDNHNYKDMTMLFTVSPPPPSSPLVMMTTTTRAWHNVHGKFTLPSPPSPLTTACPVCYVPPLLMTYCGNATSPTINMTRKMATTTLKNHHLPFSIFFVSLVSCSTFNLFLISFTAHSYRSSAHTPGTYGHTLQLLGQCMYLHSVIVSP